MAEDIRIVTPKVVAVAATETQEIPVLIVPGKQGPPGQDGSVIGGAIIDDGDPKPNRVWSSQKVHEQDEAVIGSVTPEVDLSILFDNALL